MTQEFIIQQRLFNQQIAAVNADPAPNAVKTMIAMQAQEYQMAKWAIGLRSKNLTDSSVEAAFNHGSIIRTHLLRPTWHFVHRSDLRWLIDLSAPRVQAINAYMYRQSNLSVSDFKKCNRLMSRLLKGNNFLTRPQIQQALTTEKINASGVVLSCIMMNAELEGLICSGPRIGKQFSYALLEERVPSTNSITRSRALAQFVERYFKTRGPATIQDFTTWSGLTLKDAVKGIEGLPQRFARVKIDKKEYIFDEVEHNQVKGYQQTFLMPDYDEYGMSYKDRSAIQEKKMKHPKASDYSHWLVLDGKIAGTWVHEEHKRVTETNLFVNPTKRQETDIKRAVRVYEKFKNA